MVRLVDTRPRTALRSSSTVSSSPCPRHRTLITGLGARGQREPVGRPHPALQLGVVRAELRGQVVAPAHLFRLGADVYAPGEELTSETTMSPSEPEPSNIALVLGQLLQRVSPAERALLIALAERLAADRYRGWACEVGDPACASQLLACAEREEEIARRVQALQPDAATIQRDILARNPDLEDINRSIFAGRPLDKQFALQAQGERLGAATWRSFAGREEDMRARDTFLGCAKLEEENAGCLEALLGGGG